MGKGFVLVGAMLVLLSLLLLTGPKIPLPGTSPGAILIAWDNFQLYFPCTTCLLQHALVRVALRLFR